MEITVSVGSSVKDNKPDIFCGSWIDFMDLLEEYFNEVRAPENKLINTPYIMPAIFDDNNGFRNACNATGISSWFAVDIDENIEIVILRNIFKGNRLDGCIYSTTSHTKNNHKLRGIFKLDRPVHKDDYAEFWNATNEMFGGKLDPVTKDISRIYFVPAKWSQDAYYERIIGKAHDVDSMIYEYLAKHQNDKVERLVRSDMAVNELESPSDIEVLELLNIINGKGRLPYDVWRNISWAAMKSSDNAVSMLKQVFGEETKGEYDRLQDVFDDTRAPKVNSLFWYAKQIDPDAIRIVRQLKEAESDRIIREKIARCGVKDFMKNDKVNAIMQKYQ